MMCFSTFIGCVFATSFSSWRPNFRADYKFKKIGLFLYINVYI